MVGTATRSAPVNAQARRCNSGAASTLASTHRTDSGGAGQWRGLCGSHYEKEVLADAKVYTYVVGKRYPMPGIAGGRPGEPNCLVIRYGSADPYEVERTADWVSIGAGQRIMYDYGVVLKGSLEDLTLEIDREETEALRAERRAAGGGT